MRATRPPQCCAQQPTAQCSLLCSRSFNSMSDVQLEGLAGTLRVLTASMEYRYIRATLGMQEQEKAMKAAEAVAVVLPHRQL